MKAQLAKLVKSEFHAWMKARFPDFEKVGTAFGGLVYRKQLFDKEYAFCFLCISPRLDRFTLELARSAEEEYPFDLPPGIQKQKSKRRVRINHLVDAADHGWWNTNSSHEPDLQKIFGTNDPDELVNAEGRIPRLVADAVEQLAKVLPSFIGGTQ